jgi:hypothetical protein
VHRNLLRQLQYQRGTLPTLAANLRLLADDHTLQNPGTLVDSDLFCELCNARLFQCVFSEYRIELGESVADLVDRLIRWYEQLCGLCGCGC